jgi:nucleoside-diphosphate-sugar epimerase
MRGLIFESEIQVMSIHTILGAGGVIADGLAKELIRNNIRTRTVSRNPKMIVGAEWIQADITDMQQTIRAIGNSEVVYLCIGLKYDFAVWRKQWPRIMDNVIEACGEAGAKLIFFDNVYMYGKVDGPMTEETPYNPSSKKGDLRARIATQLMSQVRKGNIVASIARAADFYGPGADKTSVPNMLVFANLAQKKRAQWLANTSVKHSFTYTPDAVKALWLLGQDKDSWNQTWHLPTASNPLTGKQFVQFAAESLQIEPRMITLGPLMIRLGGWFNKTIAELNEMLYQYKYEYLFDSSKFENAFHFNPTPYPEGIKATASLFLRGGPVL